MTITIDIYKLLFYLGYIISILTIISIVLLVKFLLTAEELNMTSNRELIKTIGKAIKHYTRRKNNET
jgi:hypothetical protein